MPVHFDDSEIQQLSVRERLDLIERIWDSLPEQVDPQDVPPWHLEILAERLAEADANSGGGQPWREALRDIEHGK